MHGYIPLLACGWKSSASRKSQLKTLASISPMVLLKQVLKSMTAHQISNIKCLTSFIKNEMRKCETYDFPAPLTPIITIAFPGKGIMMAIMFLNF